MVSETRISRIHFGPRMAGGSDGACGQAERRIDQHQAARPVRIAHDKFSGGARAEGMSDDDGRRRLERAEHIVDARGLVAPRVGAGPVRKAERRQVERDHAKTGGGERIAGAPPQLAPCRRAVKQHDGNAVGRAFLLHEHAAGRRLHQMAGRWRKLCPIGGLAERGRQAECGHRRNEQQQQDKKSLGRPAQDS